MTTAAPTRQPLDHIAREGLLRTVPFTVIRAEDDGEPGDGLTFEGYAAVWDEETLIDSWEGTFYESLARGAFKKSLRERTPKLQFDHGYHRLIGSIPIGVPKEIREDDQGVFVLARLTDNWLVQPVRDAIAEGAIDGMSFRFTVVREEWVDDHGKKVRDDELLDLLWRPDPERGMLHRTLKEVKVPELGPVVWPAYDGTSASVRSQLQGPITIDLARMNEPETRRALARAVFLADAATSGDNAPSEERSAPAPETSGTETVDAPPDNNGHPSEDPGPANGAPQATDDRSSAGEHEPSPDLSTDSRAALRAQLHVLRGLAS